MSAYHISEEINGPWAKRDTGSAMFETTLGFKFTSPEMIRFKTEFVDLGKGMELWRIRSSGHEIHLRETNKMTLLVPTRGRLDVMAHSTEFRAEPGSGILFSPNERTTRVSPPTSGGVYDALVILLSADVFGKMTPNNRPLTQDLGQSFSAMSARGAGLMSYTRFLGEELARPMSLFARRHVVNGAAALLKELLVAVLDDEYPVTKRQSAGEDYVRRAEQLMGARFDEALTMGEIADTLNIGLRSLQMAFRQHRGRAPRDVLNNIRLEEARVRLATAHEGQNVSDIALDCGFTHLGRFSVAYRQTFGERPSETLRRH